MIDQPVRIGNGELVWADGGNCSELPDNIGGMSMTAMILVIITVALLIQRSFIVTVDYVDMARAVLIRRGL